MLSTPPPTPPPHHAAVATTSNVSPQVRIIEVGPRDGLQNVPGKIVPTSTKTQLISRLYATGLTTVEITSFVSPQAVPQLADAESVLRDEGVREKMAVQKAWLSGRKDDGDGGGRRRVVGAPVLVPNVKGLERALAAGVGEVAVFVSASEGFSRANIRCSVDEGVRRAGQVAERARREGVAVRGYVSCIFADPFSGPTGKEEVLRVVRALLEMGCYEVSLGDTLGVGTPAEVRALVGYLVEVGGVDVGRLAGHFHDTYGQGVANVWEAWKCGIRAFDSSVAGLGGCPFAPGAKGNVATEDVVYMFEQAGVSTGVDLGMLVETGVWISEQLKKSNDSRAGVALASKHARMVKVDRKPGPMKLDWKVVSETDGLIVQRSGVNTKLVLNRPKNGNALTTAMISDLTNFFERAASDSSCRRVAIVGQGKFFCTGMDLGKGSSPVAQGTAESDAQYERLTRLFKLIDQAPQVTIACINGPAFGGGIGLALACDVRIAVQTATFTLSEVKLGLCPATISKYVVRELGFAFSREAMLSARPIGMEELKRIGAVAKIVPGDCLHDAVDDYLIRLKQAAPEASTMSKKLVQLGWKAAGGEGQERGIKDLFDAMMRADGEAAVGLKKFQARQRFSWDEMDLSRPRAKL